MPHSEHPSIFRELTRSSGLTHISTSEFNQIKLSIRLKSEIGFGLKDLYYALHAYSPRVLVVLQIDVYIRVEGICTKGVAVLITTYSPDKSILHVVFVCTVYTYIVVFWIHLNSI